MWKERERASPWTDFFLLCPPEPKQCAPSPPLRPKLFLKEDGGPMAKPKERQTLPMLAVCALGWPSGALAPWGRWQWAGGRQSELAGAGMAGGWKSRPLGCLAAPCRPAAARGLWRVRSVRRGFGAPVGEGLWGFPMRHSSGELGFQRGRAARDWCSGVLGTFPAGVSFTSPAALAKPASARRSFATCPSVTLFLWGAFHRITEC